MDQLRQTTQLQLGQTQQAVQQQVAQTQQTVQQQLAQLQQQNAQRSPRRSSRWRPRRPRCRARRHSRSPPTELRVTLDQGGSVQPTADVVRRNAGDDPALKQVADQLGQAAGQPVPTLAELSQGLDDVARQGTTAALGRRGARPAGAGALEPRRADPAQAERRRGDCCRGARRHARRPGRPCRARPRRPRGRQGGDPAARRRRQPGGQGVARRPRAAAGRGGGGRQAGRVAPDPPRLPLARDSRERSQRPCSG